MDKLENLLKVCVIERVFSIDSKGYILENIDIRDIADFVILSIPDIVSTWKLEDIEQKKLAERLENLLKIVDLNKLKIEQYFLNELIELIESDDCFENIEYGLTGKNNENLIRTINECIINNQNNTINQVANALLEMFN